jgi:hypothetical protein
MFERPRTVAVRATVAILVLSACTDRVTEPTPAPPLAPALRADVAEVREAGASVRWNAITRDLIAAKTAKPTQQGALRAFAYLSLAQSRAVAAAQEGDHPGDVSPQGAVAGASAVALSALFPADAAIFASQLKVQESEASGKAHDAFIAGEIIGRAVGTGVAELARTDRFDAVWTGTVPTGSGYWSTDVAGGLPQLPLLGQMRPFFMTSGDQFRPAAPPDFRSKAFRDALAEVRKLSNRNADQLRIALFWASPSPSLVAGYWNEEAAKRIVRDHLNERRAAHALALMNMAAMDAIIACHDAKYAYWLIRPYKALEELRILFPGDKELQAGPPISVPLAVKPPHPSYPSNHACFSGAAAYVLSALFPADAAKLTNLADEAAESRLYAGIHYRFDKDVGLRIARQVTALALRHDAEDDESSDH